MRKNKDLREKEGTSAKKVFRARLETILDGVRPNLQAHGGDAEIVEVIDRNVTLRLKGACAGCPFSEITFGFGIERVLRDQMPEIREIRYIQ